MLDELGIVGLIKGSFGRLPTGYAQIGDDVAVIPPGRTGERVVLKCDMLVGRTDVPPGMSWEMASRKAVAMCVSDFAAKGVRPTAFMISLALPGGTPERKVEQVASGLKRASREWGVKLVGGDTGEADDLVIDCVMAGFARRVVGRSGARAGELVVTTGPFGQTSAGLCILMEGAKATPTFRRAAVASVLTPRPRLGAGVALSRYLTASMDSSDGLAISLHTIAEASGVGIELRELPYAAGLEGFASTNSRSAEELALYGGEEYEIIGTVPKAKLVSARRAALSKGCELRVIGETTEGDPEVTLPGGRQARRDGWIHFRHRG